MRASSEEDNLGQFLARRARSASDGRLALLAAAGLIISAAVALWRGRGSMILGAMAVALTAFAAWGILDRELLERSATPGRHAALRTGRVVAAAVGALAVLAVLFEMMALALGTWVS